MVNQKCFSSPSPYDYRSQNNIIKTTNICRTELTFWASSTMQVVTTPANAHSSVVDCAKKKYTINVHIILTKMGVFYNNNRKYMYNVTGFWN